MTHIILPRAAALSPLPTVRTSGVSALVFALCACTLSCGVASSVADGPEALEDRTSANGQPAYNRAEMDANLNAVLQARPGPRSGRPLGNPANLTMWSEAKRQSLYRGIVQARNIFYRELNLRDFAHMILSESAQESTGDFTLGVRPIDFNDHASQGLIQVTPGSVVLDFLHWGKQVRSTSRQVLLDPNQAAQMDLSDPTTSLMMWAWYTKNCVAIGTSIEEFQHRTAWNSPTGTIVRDFGNAQFVWLAGPHSDRHVDDSGYQDYYNRINDYFVESGFGSQADFDRLLNTPLSAVRVGMPDRNGK